MNNDGGKNRNSALGAEMIAGMSSFCDAIEAGEAIEKRFTVRTVQLDLQTKPYGPGEVKQARLRLNVSQAILARFLGVSIKTLRSWEQGTRPVPLMACRYLDDILENPEIWLRRIRVTN